MLFPTEILLIAVLWMPVVSYMQETPNTTCESMQKLNYKDFETQVSPIPFLAYLTTNSIQGGQYLSLTLRSMTNDSFEEFTIKAVNATNHDQVLGTFDVSSSGGLAKTVDCLHYGKDSAVVHVNRNEKVEVVVNWKAPQNFSGKVEFLYTIVKEFRGKSNVLEVIPPTTKQPLSSKSAALERNFVTLQVFIVCILVTVRNIVW